VTIWQFILVALGSAVVSGFVFYWAGKESGEKACEYYMKSYEDLLVKYNDKSFALRRLEYATERYEGKVLMGILDEFDRGDDQWS
jgi:hypothetical protein